MQELASLPMRGAWIEIYRFELIHERAESLPIRGAWIEINSFADVTGQISVAPHAGSVD